MIHADEIRWRRRLTEASLKVARVSSHLFLLSSGWETEGDDSKSSGNEAATDIGVFPFVVEDWGSS